MSRKVQRYKTTKSFSFLIGASCIKTQIGDSVEGEAGREKGRVRDDKRKGGMRERKSGGREKGRGGSGKKGERGRAEGRRRMREESEEREKMEK